MKKLYIDNFKAFSEAIDIDLDNCKNLIIYGENGSGKSSIYEALRYTFLKDLFERKNISIGVLNGDAQVAKGAKDSLRNSLNNTKNKKDFLIKINEAEDISLNDNYEVFLLSNVELVTNKELDIATLIKNLYSTINSHDFALSSAENKELEEQINLQLESFLEDIRVSISNGKVVVTDPVRGLPNITEDLNFYLNEAKCNIIIMLIYLSLFQLKTKNSTKKRLIVLDDIVTSLDSANRTFIINFLLSNFNKDNDQLILMTHNTSFYNVLDYQIEDKDKWLYLHLYEANGIHRCYINTKSEILVNETTQINSKEQGNKLRQKFESLLHEFAMLLSVNALDENNVLIDRLLEDRPFYYNIKGAKPKNVYDLIDEIQTTIQSKYQTNISQRIQKKINGYKVEKDDIKILQNCLRDSKLYLKVTMHPLSHYSGGAAVDYTSKEVKISMTIMKKLERTLLKLKSKNLLVDNL